MEKSDLSKLLNHYFIDYLFATENFQNCQLKDVPYLNHETVAYREKENEILLLQILSNEQTRFYLWIINLNFMLEPIDEKKPREEYLKQLKEKYFLKVQVSFTSVDEKQVQFPSATKTADLPLNFQLSCNQTVISFRTSKRIFVAALKKDELAKPEKILKVNEVRLEGPESVISAVKWHPEVPVCLGVLCKNKFYIYDISVTLDSYDFTLSLVPQKKKKSAISFPHTEHDENTQIVDFTVCTKDSLEDFRYLSVFFLSDSGEIFYYAPIFISRLQIPKMEFQYKIKQMTENLEDESTTFYHKLQDCIELNSQLKDGVYTLKSVKETQFASLATGNSIQG